MAGKVESGFNYKWLKPGGKNNNVGEVTSG